MPEEGSEAAEDRLRAVWDLYEDSPTIGDFNLTTGFGPKPIDFEPHFNWRMWNDYQWSMRIAPPPINPVIITGI
jgi:hypothetical protein